MFDVVRRLNVVEKLVPIPGDVAELGLGISEEDRNRIANVSIVSSVQSDEPLKQAVLMNTRELMRFADKLPDLNAEIHVSTMCSNEQIHSEEENLLMGEN